MVKALIIRAPGTNCDAELARAFEVAGAKVDVVHLDALVRQPRGVDAYGLIGLPGGFSYGDDVASGRIFAMRLKRHLYPALREAAQRGCLMFAVCNGFQIAVQAGLLPGPAAGAAWSEEPAEQEVALTFNSGGRFIDRWVPVRAEPSSVCVWTRGLEEAFAADGDAMMLPIAHGEGRFVVRDDAVLQRLRTGGQIALRYGRAPLGPTPPQPLRGPGEPAAVPAWTPHPDNPNGSTDDIVGICDASGRIFGLMPHPERYLDWNRHPFWTRLKPTTRGQETPGRMMFRNAVQAAAAAHVGV